MTELRARAPPGGQTTSRRAGPHLLTVALPAVGPPGNTVRADRHRTGYRDPHSSCRRICTPRPISRRYLLRTLLSHALALLAATGLLATVPVTMAAQEAPARQTITIHEERVGDGPCDFLVERTVDGTVALVPSIDAAGNLVLAIAPVTLHGALTNPATGKSVELRWVRSNGMVDFGHDDETTTVAWALDGHFFRGHEGGRTYLTMTLPLDGGERLAFEAGQHSADPWTHACGLLA
jgi:hypothetical protein